MADPAPAGAPSAPAPSPPEPGAAAAAAAADGEAEAWAALTARWDDEQAHLAYLARQAGLEGLAAAGARYREVLAARPDDPRALAMRAEVVRRATALGLAMLPRTAPPAPGGGRWRRVAVVALAAWLALALAFLLWKLLAGPLA